MVPRDTRDSPAQNVSRKDDAGSLLNRARSYRDSPLASRQAHLSTSGSHPSVPGPVLITRPVLNTRLSDPELTRWPGPWPREPRQPYGRDW
jgi:hypothetical protein